MDRSAPIKANLVTGHEPEAGEGKLRRCPFYTLFGYELVFLYSIIARMIPDAVRNEMFRTNTLF